MIGGLCATKVIRLGEGFRKRRYFKCPSAESPLRKATLLLNRKTILSTAQTLLAYLLFPMHDLIAK
jgi:hypothetical protein